MPRRPKIGVALSGGAGKAIAHIGVLEVLTENNIPIDYITACSSATFVAASYACKSMNQFKTEWLKADTKFLVGLLEVARTGAGVISIDKFVDWLKTFLLNKNFEDVRPPMGFVVVDILTGSPVLLRLGEITKAIQASCAVPGLIVPVVWGDRVLVDGGLFSIVPTSEAKEMGADIVIGVDIAASRYQFRRPFQIARKGYNYLKGTWPVRGYLWLYHQVDRLFSRSINFVFYHQSDFAEYAEPDKPGMFAILGMAIDIAIQQTETRKGVIEDCDCLISPKVKDMGHVSFKNAEAMVAEGRRATEEAIPEIKRLIQDFETRQHLKEMKKSYHNDRI